MPTTKGKTAGVLILHGFPSGLVVASHIGADLPQLADRMAEEMGWTALTLRFRGCGQSDGNFSLRGWVDDARSGLDHLAGLDGCDQIWVVGFGTGGAVGLNAAVERIESGEAQGARVAGAALIGTPADFDDWAQEPERLLAHARQAGAVTDVDFPADPDAWQTELATVRASAAAERFGDLDAVGERALLVLHGFDDEAVPQLDARMVAEAHGLADLRLINGAGHQLRHDPRSMAILLGWLERRRNS